MQMEEHLSKLLLVFILFLNIADSVKGTLQPDVSGNGKKSSKKSITFGDTFEHFPRQKRSVLTDHGYGSRVQAGSNVAKSSSVLRDLYGQYGPGKRSSHSVNLNINRMRALQRMKRILSDYGYGSRLQAGENVANSNEQEGLFGIAGPGKRSAEMTDFDMLNEALSKAKRINTDYGYGSRLQAVENVANSYDRKDIFGIAGPGKRSPEVTDFDMFREDMVKDKRVETDYGYGSRLQAAENVAKDWNYNGLFGVMGQGKRSNNDKPSMKELVKRISVDFGYGSRSQAAENAAKLSSNEDLFGVYGPGKRNSGSVVSTGSPEYEILKRILDFGYGSRLQADADLFGTYGPGERNSDIALFKGNLAFELQKRLSADFGYRSRTQATANVAKSSSNAGLFGTFGPGKRSSVTDIAVNKIIKRINSDYGYGSRLQAAENAAKSSSNSELFGIYGPGKRNNIKREISDYGYGSRLQAAENVAQLASREKLFGVYGPGK